jgi:hypothetical protein
VARHATLLAPRAGASTTAAHDDELVVLDLDDLTPVDTRAEEDRPPPFDAFATLPFGLGTVPRRIRAERATRTPLWLLALAAIAMVAALSGNPSSTGSTSGARATLLEAPTGASVAVLGYDRVVTLDIDRHTSHVVRLAGLHDGETTSAAPAGAMFVPVIDGHAWAVSRLLDRPATDLGPADAVFGTGIVGQNGVADVWLARRDAAGWELRLVDPAAGRVLWQGTSAPTRALVGASGNAVVLDDGRGTAALIGPVRSTGIAVHGTVLGAGNGAVVTRTCTRRTCAIEVVDVGSGRTHRISTPLEPGVHVGPAAFGPHGATFAALVDGRSGPSTRALVVRDGEARVVELGGPGSGLAWSGDWLFVLRADGQLDAVGPVGRSLLVDSDPLPNGALVGLPAS